MDETICFGLPFGSMSISGVTPVHLYMTQGADFSLILDALSDESNPLSHVTMYSYQAKAQIRDKVGGDLLLELTVEITDPATGEITVSATADQTATLIQDGVWDCFIFSGTNRYPVCAGNVFVKKSVTVFV